MECDPAETDTSAAQSPQERLKAYIRNMIHNFTVTDKLSRFNRLYQIEMINPTGLIQDTWHDQLESQRERVHNIIREVIGPQADDLTVRLCELSIVNQCRVFVTVKQSDLEYMLGRPLGPELIGRVAEHIAGFSLGGVVAVGGESTGIHTT